MVSAPVRLGGLLLGARRRRASSLVVVLVVLVLVVVVLVSARRASSCRLRRSSPIVRLRKTSSRVCASRCSSRRTQPLSTMSWKISGRRSSSFSLDELERVRALVGRQLAELLHAVDLAERVLDLALLGERAAAAVRPARPPTPGSRRRSERARSWRGSRRAGRRRRCGRCDTMMARAQTASTSARLCVESRTVRSLPICFRYSRNSAFSFGSRSLVGSSRMRIGGSWMSACARPTRWR